MLPDLWAARVPFMLVSLAAFVGYGFYAQISWLPPTAFGMTFVMSFLTSAYREYEAVEKQLGNGCIIRVVAGPTLTQRFVDPPKDDSAPPFPHRSRSLFSRPRHPTAQWSVQVVVELANHMTRTVMLSLQASFKDGQRVQLAEARIRHPYDRLTLRAGDTSTVKLFGQLVMPSVDIKPEYDELEVTDYSKLPALVSRVRPEEAATRLS